MQNFWLVIFAYLLGSFPSGLVIGKLFYHTDLREQGSGNIGTTNAFRAFGKLGGSVVFIGDMLKGAIPVLLAGSVATSWHPVVFGLSAIFGHTFPIFLKFKGGKAVATSFGVGLAIAPLFALIVISVFFIVLYIGRMVSLASIVAVIFALILSFFWQDTVLTILVAIIAVTIIVRHKENIERIRKGTESKVPFGLGSKSGKIHQ